MIHLSDVPEGKGDIKILSSNNILVGTAAIAAYTSVDTISIPAIGENEELVLFVESVCDTFAAPNEVYTDATLNATSPGCPCRLKTVNQRVFAKAHIWKCNGSTDINFLSTNYAGVTLGGVAINRWGDVTVAHDIYLTILTNTVAIFQIKWTLYKIGLDVK